MTFGDGATAVTLHIDLDVDMSIWGPEIKFTPAQALDLADNLLAACGKLVEIRKAAS